MKVAVIAVLGGVVFFCGCSTTRTFRPGMTGGGAGSSVGPNSTPSLGIPSPTFPGQSNSSSYGPAGGKSSGPSLGWPEASQDSPASASDSSRTLAAPDPKRHGTRYRGEPAADPVSSADRPSILDEPTWSRFYRSTDRRPIETLILGSGSARIAILGSLHGDETQSVSLVEALARSLRSHPEQLRGATVLLVKCPNPDAFYGRSPYNLHGIDLNRNFPSDNWKELTNGRAGTRSASEAETRVIVRVLGDFQPTLLVHLKDSRRGGVINYEGEIREAAEKIAGMTSSQVVSGLGEKTSGSVECYALTRLKCPNMTLLLAREDSDEAAWARNHDALLALVGQRTGNGTERSQATPQNQEGSNSLDVQPDPFEEPAIQKSSMRRQRPAAQNSGSSSKTTAQSRDQAPLPDFPAPVPDQGYLELPPP
jgi:protein MpaA